tara:strand:+ start:122 stop:460 length:339 start_codon:yes stop_codon:yes gene_type:complete
MPPNPFPFLLSRVSEEDDEDEEDDGLDATLPVSLLVPVVFLLCVDDGVSIPVVPMLIPLVSFTTVVVDGTVCLVDEEVDDAEVDEGFAFLEICILICALFVAFLPKPKLCKP